MAGNDSTPEISSKNQLVEYLESGCRPKSDWRLGTEHEKFAFLTDSLRPVPYAGKRSINAILSGLAERYDWRPVVEDSHIIALTDATGASITLEPGGQLELSGALLDDIHMTCREVNTHLKQVKSIAEPLDIAFIGLGFQPKWKREDTEWMPKARYQIMRDYMPKRGTMGLDMMSRTCTVQVNLDFSSEADMVHKFRTSLALQPIATALFANSPFLEGQLSGFNSLRSHVWEDTDPDRTGILPFVFEEGMGFERYVEYMLDVPMYFVYRDGQYLDASGQSFRDFMDGKLPACPGERPSVSDWEDHLTTAFPEVRLKKFLEMRGADGGPWARLCALPAFWVGLLYHQESLDAAWDLTASWSLDERQKLRRDAARFGLNAKIRGQSIQEIAQELLKMAHEGLMARNRLNASGDNETGFLSPLVEIADSGQSPADRKIKLFESEWDGSVDPIFRQFAY